LDNFIQNVSEIEFNAQEDHIDIYLIKNICNGQKKKNEKKRERMRQELVGYACKPCYLRG
jgi:hypothetical protein